MEIEKAMNQSQRQVSCAGSAGLLQPAPKIQVSLKLRFEDQLDAGA